MMKYMPCHHSKFLPFILLSCTTCKYIRSKVVLHHSLLNPSMDGFTQRNFWQWTISYQMFLKLCLRLSLSRCYTVKIIPVLYLFGFWVPCWHGTGENLSFLVYELLDPRLLTRSMIFVFLFFRWHAGHF